MKVRDDVACTIADPHYQSRRCRRRTEMAYQAWRVQEEDRDSIKSCIHVSRNLSALDSRHAELTRAVNEVPVSARNRRPSEDRWSVAEVLEHLALVEENIAPLMKRLVTEQRANGLGAERDSSPVAQTLN